MKMAPEEIEALAAFPEIDHTGHAPAGIVQLAERDIVRRYPSFVSEDGWMSDRPAARALAVILGIPNASSDAELKRAFRMTVKRLHPDTGGASSSTREIDELLALHALYLDELAGSTVQPDPDPWDEAWGRPAADVGDATRSSQSAAEESPRDTARSQPGPAPWWTPSEPGPSPKPGFWSQRP